MPRRTTGSRWRFAVAALFVVAIRAASAGPPNVRFHHWTVDDGLSQSGANAIAQDRYGFMWFGTQDGLNRFDGHTFTVFKHQADDPGSLPHSFVWSILAARDGTLWIGTDGGGLVRKHATDATFSPPPIPAGVEDVFAGTRVRDLAEGPDGTVWAAVDKTGLVGLDPRTGKTRIFRNDPGDPGSLAGNATRVVHVDRRGAVWVGTEGAGLDRLDPGSTRFVHFRHDPGNPLSLGNDRIRSLLEDRKGRIWVGMYEGGLARIDPSTGKIDRFDRREGDPTSLAHDRVRAIVEDRDGVVWVGTDGGLCRLAEDARGFTTYRHDPVDARSLGADRVLALHQDSGGVLWVATQTGLDTWNPTIGSFEHVHQGSDPEMSIGSDTVTAFAADPSGATWIGSYGGGLDRLDRRTGRVKHFRHDPADAASLSDDRVMSLLMDRTGGLWVGTLEGGLNRLDTVSGRFRRYVSVPGDPTTLSSPGVTSLYEDPSGVLWVGVFRGGLCRMDRSSGTFRCYRADSNDAASLSSDRVMAISGSASGAIWIGTDGGGFDILDPATGRFSRHRHDPADPGSLSSDVVWSIHEGKDGTLWIGTQSGLNRWRPQDRRAGRVRFQRYGERDGLPNAFVYAVLEDADGRLWLSTNRGIARFDPARETFVSFDVSQGLQSNEFNFGAALASPSGEMYFGGNNGFNVFRPEAIRPNAHVPPAVVTGVLRLDEPMKLDAPPWGGGRVVIGHTDPALTFELASLDYTAPWRNRLRFRLEGFDEKWMDPGPARRATYTNLPPGRYTFRVRGSNGHGVWNETGSSIGVVVLPPPWRTWWAHSLYVFLLGTALLSVIQAQRRKSRRAEELQHRLENEVRARTRELAERNETLAQVNARLEEASVTDALTGLRNRRYMMTQLQSDLANVDRMWTGHGAARLREVDGVPSVLFCALDLDGFKPINDRFGHEAGDRVLCSVRDALVASCREGDTVIRLGGDEFLVVCRQVDRGAAPKIAERIRDAVAGAATPVGDGETVSVGCSVGFAIYPFSTTRPKGVSWERVLALADRALYLAKNAGRSAWVGITCNERVPIAEEVPDVLADPLEAASRGVISLASDATLTTRPEGSPAIGATPQGRA